MTRSITVLLALVLLAPWPPTPPTVEWVSSTRAAVTWIQAVDGKRCLANVTQGLDYGCLWAWQGPNTVPIKAARSGDWVAVGDDLAVVPPHRVYFPVIAR